MRLTRIKHPDVAGPLFALLVSGSAVAQESADEGNLWAFLGHFHPVILHLPIGLIIALFVYEICAWPFGEARRGDLARWVMLGLGAVTAVISAVFGIFLSWTATYDSDILWEHKWTGIGVAVAISLALVSRIWFNTSSKKAALWAYRGMVVVAAGFLLPAGHHGGELTHGKDFLIEDIPPSLAFLTPILGPEEESHPMADVGSGYFANDVLPILEQKCFECHGAEKQKGDLRMDSREDILSTGESGKLCVVPGDPGASYMMELMLLPPENDDIMPPAGKTQLEPAEIVTLAQWIARGAPWGDYEPPPPAEPKSEEPEELELTSAEGASATPVVKTDEIMQLFFEDPPERMAEALRTEPADRKARRLVLKEVFNDANALAEAHNLLFSRNDEDYMSTPEWIELTVRGRTAATDITEYLKDRNWEYGELKARYEALIASCNQCHTHFETDTDEILAWPEAEEKSPEPAESPSEK